MLNYSVAELRKKRKRQKKSKKNWISNSFYKFAPIILWNKKIIFYKVEKWEYAAHRGISLLV